MLNFLAIVIAYAKLKEVMAKEFIEAIVEIGMNENSSDTQFKNK